MRTRTARVGVVTTLVAISSAWSNGQSGNARTDEASECDDPPYATHDWIADHALDMLPDEDKAWLVPHRAVYLIGTEAPDNSQITAACGTPNLGYGDTGLGHSVEWNANHTELIQDRAARRAQEEYNKAVIAFAQHDSAAAAFYLGAMAHYIGDVSQFGHAVPFETPRNHRNYESWGARRTDEFSAGVFEDNLSADGLVRRTPYTAVKRISRATSQGSGATQVQILSLRL